MELLLLVVLALLYQETKTQSCNPPISPGNGSVSYVTLTPLSVATYTCDHGYQMSGAISVTCNCPYACSWSDGPPSCSPVDCGFPAANVHSTISCPDTTYNTYCTATCNVGYYMTGSTQLLCLASGLRDFLPPICTIYDCMVLPAPTNGQISFNPDTFYGGVAAYTCDPGYSISGPATRTCQVGGLWSDSNAWCVLNDCTQPQPPTSGTVTCPSLLVDSTCTFTCDDGYVISGASVITCQTDGTWSLLPPTCSAGGAGCGQALPITRGTLSYPAGTLYGDIVTYTCDAGFALSGPSYRTCLTSGWSDTEPVCVLGDCTMPGNPTNGFVLCSPLVVGGSCTFGCNPGYSVSGAAVITCLASNAWDLSLPTCILTSSLPCASQWVSPVFLVVHIEETPVPDFTLIMTTRASSALQCFGKCSMHAQSACGIGSECRMSVYEDSTQQCSIFAADYTSGYAVPCSPTSPCYLRQL